MKSKGFLFDPDTMATGEFGPGFCGPCVAALDLVLIGLHAKPEVGAVCANEWGPEDVGVAARFAYICQQIGLRPARVLTLEVLDRISDLCGFPLRSIPHNIFRSSTCYIGCNTNGALRRHGKSVTERGLVMPPWLNRGSSGRAVSVLQMFLIGSCRTSSWLLEMLFDGKYGHVVTALVKELQAKIEVETDGNFGQQTRAAVLKEFGINFNALPMSAFYP